MQPDLEKYYQDTANDYDSSHLGEVEHEVALAVLTGLLLHYRFESLLDVGAGTGRVLRLAGPRLPNVRIRGIEPSASLREVGYQQGINPEDLQDGNALGLPYPDNSWDVVCAFGILHHIADPEAAIREMCRVAKHAVFFSDLNNFGCGSILQRCFSQTLRSLHLWKMFQFIKNGGKYEKFSEGDGLHYSYSLFDSLPTIRRKFPQTHLMNTRGNGENILRSCPNFCVFAVSSIDFLIERRQAESQLSMPDKTTPQ
jgi:ubiquinone/menaquinone biosynthesis C-methylase UbiE